MAARTRARLFAGLARRAAGPGSWPPAIRVLAACAVAACALGACTFGDGAPFGILSARIDAGLDVPEDRPLGDGWHRLASSYQVRIDTLEVEAGDLLLYDRGAGGAGFDPADPPAGYSLCHNGHCHADDGRLVPYEEIAAELGGGGQTLVVAMPVGPLDLVAGVVRELDCAPGCDLPRADIARATLGLARVRATGLIRDGRTPARIAGEIPWVLDLALAGDDAVTLSLATDIPVDREHDPGVTLAAELRVGSPMLDGVSWADLPVGPIGEPGDGYDVTSADAARGDVAARLAEVDLAVSVTR